jgi:hypothetical protein
MAIQSARLREHLDAHCGNERRITVFWSCGGQVFCTTGKVLDLFDDVLVIAGFVPTAREKLAGDHGCGDRGGEDSNSLELITFIHLDRVCAVVTGLPPCREACLPRCCPCREPHDEHGGMP